MYYAFVAPDVPAPSRANRFLYFIRVDRFMEEAYDEAFEYDWTRTGENRWTTDLAQYEKHKFPLAVVGRGRPGHCRSGHRIRGALEAREAAAHDAGDERPPRSRAGTPRTGGSLTSILKASREQFQISYIELDQELELDKVCDIFTQINSRGIRLDVFDLINALLKPRAFSSSTCGAKRLRVWTSSRPSG